jgi:hypothetical protein
MMSRWVAENPPEAGNGGAYRFRCGDRRKGNFCPLPKSLPAAFYPIRPVRVASHAARSARFAPGIPASPGSNPQNPRGPAFILRVLGTF